MDTRWFALDEKGQLGVFSTHEEGALPNLAFTKQFEPFLEELGAALATEHAFPWRRRLGELEPKEIALVTSTDRLFESTAEDRRFERVADGFYVPRAVEPDVLEACLGDGTVNGFATRADLVEWVGLAEYEHLGGGGSGDYHRVAAPPKKGPALAPALMCTFGSLVLPVDFSKTESLSLLRFMKESEVFVWDLESGFSYGEGAAVWQKRRFEFVEGTSKKFWEVEVGDSELVVRFGRLGTKGKTQRTPFIFRADALVVAERRIKEKTEKGYREITEGSEPAP